MQNSRIAGIRKPYSETRKELEETIEWEKIRDFERKLEIMV